MHTKTWNVQILLSEADAVTNARAVLITEAGTTTVQGSGIARVHPHEPAVPEIGDEIAASRALAALANTLLDTAMEDVRGVLQQT